MRNNEEAFLFNHDRNALGRLAEPLFRPCTRPSQVSPAMRSSRSSSVGSALYLDIPCLNEMPVPREVLTTHCSSRASPRCDFTTRRQKCQAHHQKPLRRHKRDRANNQDRVSCENHSLHQGSYAAALMSTNNRLATSLNSVTCLRQKIFSPPGQNLERLTRAAGNTRDDRATRRIALTLHARTQSNYRSGV